VKKSTVNKGFNNCDSIESSVFEHSFNNFSKTVLLVKVLQFL